MIPKSKFSYNLHSGSLSSLCFCKNGFWSSSSSLPLPPSVLFSLFSLLSHLSLSRRKQVPIASDTEENHFSVVSFRSQSSHPTVLASKVRTQNSELVVSLISIFFMFSPLNLDSWAPAVWRIRAFLYTGLLSDDECDHLINLAKDKLEKSMVADNDSGKSIMSEVRTSSGMFLNKHQDEIVGRIERRIAAWTFLPEGNSIAPINL
ncbi:putative prolyl 4-hydroxylase 6 isoform X1 [Cinnamomum micranthum f. kanehirae]|uniref:Putative prolyl 4-hydroxylase 6 isoform X1 n=1 Tax=Cinnamomum micranthum f. kanehirae TaxID=337451 RepID=A0A3S3MC56_9MAGN|nr:putative prolyl 4-hydroxylase 6 isoform X1 [Cinnamomum micranthum f. kanehirae]